MRLIQITSLILIFAYHSRALPDYYLEARSHPILIDGLAEREWLDYETNKIEFPALSEHSASWRGTYDNSYYYFLVEVIDGDGTGNNVRFYVYGSSSVCSGSNPIPDAPPESRYRISWRQDLEGIHLREERVFDSGSKTLADSSGVLLAATVSSSGYTVEIAIPSKLIGSSLGAGGDFNWTTPIQFGISIFDDGALSQIVYWPENDYATDVCDLAEIGFSGWPGDSVTTSPASVAFEAVGGSTSISVEFADESYPLEIQMADRDNWLSSAQEGRMLTLTAVPNTGRHRSALVRFEETEADPYSLYYGTTRVVQYGKFGTPWDFDPYYPSWLGGHPDLTDLDGWQNGYLWESQWFSSYVLPDAYILNREGLTNETFIYSFGHQAFLYSIGVNSENVLFYDFGLNCWWWTSGEVYPFVYLWDEQPSWFWFYQGASSRGDNRWFFDFEASQWRQASEMKALF
jgi:hypothetical protein